MTKFLASPLARSPLAVFNEPPGFYLRTEVRIIAWLRDSELMTVPTDFQPVDETTSSETSAEIIAPVEVTIKSEDLDSDGFISIWNVAASSCGGDLKATRQLAANLLCFLCKKRCDFVVTSSTNLEYLTSKYERDAKLFGDWKPESENVDIVAQHADVPGEILLKYLRKNKFNPASKYAANRNSRVEWFQNDWCVG